MSHHPKHSVTEVPDGADDRREHRAVRFVLSCSDSDAAIWALLRAHPDARDIEITAAGLEDAFVQLTADANDAEPLEVAR